MDIKSSIGQVLTLQQLDAKMVEFGYYSETEYIENKEIIESGAIYYFNTKDEGVTISFKVDILADDNELLSETYVKIVDIY